MFPEIIYYEPRSLDYPLGRTLIEKYADVPKFEIESHNNIEELRKRPNADFPEMKRYLIIGVRKTHKYVENHKISDYLVPFTSSGCTAMCLYCYLVCNYNKCSYLRVFVNREEMTDILLKRSWSEDSPKTFEIGSNSDLVLENTITKNLPLIIEEFAENGRGNITFPTKFCMINDLTSLDHRGKTIFRMSVNPAEIIKKIELGTSPLDFRIDAVNRMCEAGYPCGIIIAPVMLLPDWEKLYGGLISELSDKLSDRMKKTGFIEVIFLTFSFVQNAINREAFPDSPELFDKTIMTGRGRGKYCYRENKRKEAEDFLRSELHEKLSGMRIIYIV